MFDESLLADPSTARPILIPVSSILVTGAIPDPSVMFECRAVGHPHAGASQLVDVPLVQDDEVGKPGVVAQPAEVVHEVNRPAPEAVEAVGLFVLRLRQVGVNKDAVFVGQSQRFRHQVLRDRKGRTRREGDPKHRERLRVVVPFDHPDAVGDDLVLRLNHAVGRQPPVLLRQGHRTATRMEPDPGSLRPFDVRIEDVPPPRG